MESAEAKALRRNLLLVQIAAQEPKHWQAAAWLLERRYPESFGRREHVTHAGDSDSPLRVETRMDLSKVGTDDLETLERILEQGLSSAETPSAIEAECGTGETAAIGVGESSASQ